MDLKKLETLRSFASQGSLERTAIQRGITLQAVSIQLKKLEQELGAKLFDRGPNRMVLTERGRNFVRDINQAFDIFELAKASLIEPSDEFTGTVSVSLATDIVGFFAPELAEFAQKHPKLNIKILARPSRECKALVIDGEADIGVGFFPIVPRNIERTRICDSGISLLFPPGHPLEKKRNLSLSEIGKHRVVVRPRSSATRRMIESAFNIHNVELTDVLEVGSCQSALTFVRLGLGVGLVHTICCKSEPNMELVQKDMSRFFGRTDITLSLIRRKSSIFGPAQKALLDTFIDSAAARQLAQR